MKSKAKIGLIFNFICFLSVFFISGCATNRGLVSLKMPDAEITVAANGKTVFVQSVVDNREFQEKPATPNIPSLGSGGVSAASDDIKKRAIARKRNSYGMAIGDILLENNQTVETVVKSAVERSFLELGYKVVEAAEADSLVVDVSIQKFWSWMNPGFWVIRLSSEIETKLTLTSPGKNDKKEIYVIFEKRFQTALEGNWLKVMDGCIREYINKLKSEL